MRLEWINNDKVIVNYRVEFQTEFERDHWSFIKQYKTLEQAQNGVTEFKNNSYKNVTKIRIVKYTQIIEIINTEYSEVNNDR